MCALRYVVLVRVAETPITDRVRGSGLGRGVTEYSHLSHTAGPPRVSPAQRLSYSGPAGGIQIIIIHIHGACQCRRRP